MEPTKTICFEDELGEVEVEVEIEVDGYFLNMYIANKAVL